MPAPKQARQKAFAIEYSNVNSSVKPLMPKRNKEHHQAPRAVIAVQVARGERARAKEQGILKETTLRTFRPTRSAVPIGFGMTPTRGRADVRIMLKVRSALPRI